MNTFLDYFNEKDIIFYLCKLRSKYAMKKKNEHLIHLLTTDEKYNHHLNDEKNLSGYERKFMSDLYELLPNRKKWKKIGENSRYKSNSNQKISSFDKNVNSLVKTIKFYKKKNQGIDFLVNLDAFIADLRNTIQSTDFEFSRPNIYPKPKNKKKEKDLNKGEYNICRPISLYNLKDRLILSFTNKYLTKLFDPYFECCSLAFRIPRLVNGKKVSISHHTAVEKILNNKNKFIDIPLWVAECDIKKFYDSVDHKIILEKFEILIDKAEKDNEGIDLSLPKNIFKKYLECYCFNIDVLKLNEEDGYWKNHNIPKGKFDWIENVLEEQNMYEIINESRIGIPQGGALSGLIANIVLDVVDKEVLNINDLFYVRFCDDMIIMHDNKTKCQDGLNKYQTCLKELKLIHHKVSDKLLDKRKKPIKYLPETTLASFWKCKSKGPFKWDEVVNGGIPWIGFVGYEIHYKKFIRVRKSSLENEIKKQKDVVNRIKNSIKNGKRKKSKYIINSAIQRLTGMSVGRVEIWNYSFIENEMCWINGFKEINKNKYSIKQLKQLDRSRSKIYYDFIKFMKENYGEDFIKEEKSEEEGSKKKKNDKRKHRIKHDRPFSYYYQALKNK